MVRPETHAPQQRRLEAGRTHTADFADKLRPDKDGEGEFDGSLIAALNELAK